MRVARLLGGIALTVVLTAPALAEEGWAEEQAAKRKAEAEAAKSKIDVCDELGLSGLTISGDDNCLVITGKVSYEYDWGDYNTDETANNASLYHPDGLPVAATVKLKPAESPLGFALYGGLIAPGTVTFTTPDDLNAGVNWDAEGHVNVGSVFNRDGMQTGALGVVVDANDGSQEFTNYGGDFIDWTALTLGSRFTAFINKQLGVFVGAGAGVVNINERYPTGGSGMGGTVYAEAGAQMRINEVVSLGLKAELQGMPMAIKASNGYDVQTSHLTIQGGLLFDIPASTHK